MTEMASLISADETEGVANIRRSAPGPRIDSRKGRAARSRSMIYSILAQALSAPSEALCSSVEDGGFWILFRYAVDGAPSNHRREIATLLEKLAGDSEPQSPESILIEYTRLFASNLHCPQYEADYLARTSDGAVHAIAGVVNMYSTFGVKLGNDVTERPDHIAVELDFMNFLAGKEAHANDRGKRANARLCRRAQARFLGDHLLRWGSAFARNLGDVTSLGFYQDVRELLEMFLQIEAKYLGVEPRPPSFPQESDVVSQACRCRRCAGGSEPARELVSITLPGGRPLNASGHSVRDRKIQGD